MAGNRSGRRLGPALVFIAGILPLPIAASIITAAIYITPTPPRLLNLTKSTIGLWLGPQWMTIVAGLVLTLILWFVLSWFTQNTTAIDSVNADSALHLKSHLSTLEAAFTNLPKPSHSPIASSSFGEDKPQYHIAYRQVEKYLPEINTEIDAQDVRWVTARGYLRAWNLLHRAEEAIIDLESSDEVIREAWHDEMSLKGSGMDSEADALHKLRTAIIQLSPSAAVYLNKEENTSSSITGDGERIKLEARAALRDVRKTLNEYRDHLWEGLVRERNQLMATTFITGLFTYFLLAFAIIVGAPRSSIEAAVAFYLAGGLSGLFIRFYNESQSDKAVDDFNLTMARILVTPFISGLAAVGGILLLATLTFSLTQSTTTSVSAAIANVFNLDNGLGIVLATIFGYAPNLFVNALQKRAQDVTTQLQNTSPQNQGTPAPAPGTPAQFATNASSLTFKYVVDQSSPPAQQITITNSGGSTLSWQATARTVTGGAWLTITPAIGSLSSQQSGSIGVTAAVISGLNPGTYTGTITIAGKDDSGHAATGSPQSIPVTFTVSSACAVAAAPVTLTFDGQVGGTDPDPQAVTISATGACDNSLNWSAEVATTPPDGKWLSTTPSKDSVRLSAPSVTKVEVALKDLSADIYNGTVTITATDSVTNKQVGTQQVIKIMLTVTAK